MGVKNEDPKKPIRKNWIYYYLVVLVITMLINALVVPAMAERSVTEVSYDTFLEMLEKGEVTGLTRGTDQYTFWTGQISTENGKLRAEDLRYYKTGLWPDEKLTERLAAAGVQFSNQIPTKASPLQSLIFNWILPIVIFVGLGQLMSRMMMKRMGGMGNAMTFGKSNAKIYAENETGKTFADVAGQEEAKEALKEIVDFLHNPQKYAEIGRASCRERV